MKRLRVMLFSLILIIGILPTVSAFGADRASISEEKLKQIDSYVREQFEIGGFPGGAYAIIDRDRTVVAEGIGYTDLKTKQQVDKDTIYATASVTKAMTASAIIMLAEQGKLELDAPVITYLPWFQYKDKALSATVTVQDLLTHSAGISRYKADGAIYKDIKKNRNSMENAVKALNDVEMSAAPGQKGQYCNTCFNTLGLIIEAASGQSYEMFMHEQIFKPLGMNSTGFNTSTYSDEQIAKEYGFLFGIRMEMSPYWKVFGSSQAPEGGAYSSVADLARFVSAALGFSSNGFISTDRFAEYSQIGVTASDLKETRYVATGFEEKSLHGQKLLVKSGEGMGSTSQIVLIPEQQLGIVLLVGELK